ncbi:hypothetical protein CDL12_12037 [Handroanthus impetiginosus]|uniref:Nucleotide-diphospho-sugar transferase domain-containing protein n=1 Tax=Handroanthus impetiginosus TaxID=429701 RepID=A0A2G9HCS9_9LAMI|nr:hypothetical protein CDL12_12037 [Handroanthus impetiginosus]
MDSGGGGGSSSTVNSCDFHESSGNSQDHHHHHFSGVSINITLLFVGVGIIYLANVDNNMENTLTKATMKDNKIVIITTLKAAWTKPNSIFDLFLESFRIGNKTQNAYSRCLQVHRHRYALTTACVDFSGEAFYITKDYLKMLWRRTDFLRIVLEAGYNFVFTIYINIYVLKFYPNVDFQIACDHYGYDYRDLRNSPNGGFNIQIDSNIKSYNQKVFFFLFRIRRHMNSRNATWDDQHIYATKVDVLNINKNK